MNKQRMIIDRFYQNFKDSFYHDVPVKHPDALSDFRKAEFGEKSLQEKDCFNQWMYQQNQNNQRIYCYVDDQVVGHQSAMKVDLKVGDKVVKAAYATDLRVRPEWKMKGLGVALMGKLINDYDVVISLGVSDEAYKMFKRQGWIDLGKTNFYLKPLTIKGLFSKDAPMTPAIRLRNYLALVYSKMNDLICSIVSPSLELAPFTQFNDSHEKLCELTTNESKNWVRKNKEYLNWRFFSFPGKYQYEAFQSFDKNGELSGFAVVKKTPWKDREALVIVELHTREDNLDAFVHQLIKKAKQKKVDVVLFQGIEPLVEKALLKRAFFIRPYGDRFIIYNNRPELQDAMKDVANWEISFSDSDMDFCFY
ncbi:GNAT family N-acetyltransferase [Aliikangiella coralliicola]|uniref:GNAT family N-acetyltransferase n=1 Tax=Aliikangiella coralliicola TaxID=2592383 RepID=A0A545UHG5_9GAMM|nr:GNAT family N-acetyltransferase [Aliikangiella coralliicola]TQV88914.1 GNAT family N-acetyltransferase [Aliikangiella coralliicola]